MQMIINIIDKQNFQDVQRSEEVKKRTLGDLEMVSVECTLQKLKENRSLVPRVSSSRDINVRTV